MTFVLHRDTGEPVFAVEERPVPQNPVQGEYLSPTQPFPSHVPYLVSPISEDDAWGLTFWDEGACREQISELRNDGIYTPPTTGGSILMPSMGGGNNWGSPAIDIDSKTMVVVTWHIPATVRLLPREACEGVMQGQVGTPYCVDVGMAMSPLGVPCTEPPWATIDAVDLARGEILWRVPLGTTRDSAPWPFWWLKGVPGAGGPAVTAGGLVFIGAAPEHKFRALDLATGDTLWEGELPTAANSVPMTYQLRAGGRQFVVVAAGGHWSGINPPGDHLVAFALPDGD
jgi:quinoprotein glucose dehydrogenase